MCLQGCLQRIPGLAVKPDLPFVAQVSQPAVSPTSQSAGLGRAPNRGEPPRAQRVWKPAIRQTRRSALRVRATVLGRGPGAAADGPAGSGWATGDWTWRCSCALCSPQVLRPGTGRGPVHEKGNARNRGGFLCLQVARTSGWSCSQPVVGGTIATFACPEFARSRRVPIPGFSGCTGSASWPRWPC